MALIAIGTVGVIEAQDGVSLDALYFNNDVGGTEQLPAGRYRVRVTRTFHDYETGGRGVGELVDEADIALAAKVGTTGFGTDPDYRPTKVYFGTEQLRVDD